MANDKKSHLAVARQQMTAAGLTVLDREVLYAASPSVWTSTREALLGGDSVRSMLSVLMVEFPTASFFEAKLGERAVIGLARTLLDIEKRLEWLTGQQATAVKLIAQPLSAVHQERTRVPAIKQEESDEFAGFELDEHIASMPRHQCHNRQTSLDKLERYWIINPSGFSAEAYMTEEAQRLEDFRNRLVSLYPELGLDGTHTPNSNQS